MLQGGGYYNSVSMARALVMNDLNSLGDYLAGDIVVNMICRPNDYADDLNHNGSHSPLRKMAFGSWHPGISQFLLGDGSVRGVSVTTDTPILSAYALVDDGEAVSLP